MSDTFVSYERIERSEEALILDRSTASGLFYQSLANAVNTVRGTMLLDLYAARWKTVIGGQEIIWTVPEGCIAEIKFEYAGGVLQMAFITFEPPIRFQLMGTPRSGLLQSVKYNRFGDVIDIKIIPTDPLTPEENQRIRRNMQLLRNPKELFLGKPFAGFNSATPVDNSNHPTNGPSSFVERVRFEKPNETDPGLEVTFRDQAVIKFSEASVGSPDSFNNFITVRGGTGGSGLEFDEIDYYLDERSLRGTLRSFKVIAERGQFTSGSLFFQLKAGSQLLFNNVDFSKSSAGDVSVDASFGTLLAQLGAGSQMVLASGGATGISRMSFGDGSETNVQGFRLNIGNNHTAIEVGGGSSIQLNVIEGRLGFGRRSFVGFSPGRVNAGYSGSWDSAREVDVEVKFNLLEVNNVVGEVDVNQDTRLLLSSGTLASSDLLFKSKANPRLTGAFTTFQANIDENTRIGIPGGIQIIAAAGGQFHGATPADPLVLSSSTDYPIGKYSLDLPFKNADSSSSSSYRMHDGRVVLHLESDDQGNISGQDCSLSGVATVVAATLSANVDVRLNNISLQKPSTGSFSLSGSFSARVRPGISMSMTTDFIKGVPDHDNFRAFPLTVGFSINNPIDIPATNFTIRNGIVNLGEIVLHPSFRVTIPGGLGEHEDSDDPNSADGTHGPDEDQHRQEAVTDTFPFCRIHIYLHEGNYNFSSDVKLSISNNRLDVKVMRFVSDSQIGFHRDGCDVQEVLAIIGGIFGVLIGGPFGGLVGAIVGAVEGQSVDERVNQLVASAITNMLLKLEFDWHT